LLEAAGQDKLGEPVGRELGLQLLGIGAQVLADTLGDLVAGQDVAGDLDRVPVGSTGSAAETTPMSRTAISCSGTVPGIGSRRTNSLSLSSLSRARVKFSMKKVGRTRDAGMTAAGAPLRGACLCR